MAAEEERANVNELLFILKEKERETTQLKYVTRGEKNNAVVPYSGTVILIVIWGNNKYAKLFRGL